MSRGQELSNPKPFAQRTGERDESVTEICSQVVERLAAELPDAHVYCHLRVGNTLRVMASKSGARLIYEVRREQGGICWRAAETREPQLVEDVRRDPDYMTTDQRVCSEVAVPIVGGHDTLLVLDAEFPDRPFTADEADAILAAADRLQSELLGQSQS
jgi:GAF domain-containing protein